MLCKGEKVDYGSIYEQIEFTIKSNLHFILYTSFQLQPEEAAFLGSGITTRESHVNRILRCSCMRISEVYKQDKT